MGQDALPSHKSAQRERNKQDTESLGTQVCLVSASVGIHHHWGGQQWFPGGLASLNGCCLCENTVGMYCHWCVRTPQGIALPSTGSRQNVKEKCGIYSTPSDVVLNRFCFHPRATFSLKGVAKKEKTFTVKRTFEDAFHCHAKLSCQ